MNSNLKNPKEMSLEELQAERKPLRQTIKRLQRCGRRTPELQEMKLRNVRLKDEIARRTQRPKSTPVVAEAVAESTDFPETGDIICFYSPPSAPSPVRERQPLLVANG